jgi:RsiW-degrading membrane proteinase PrsW (M82 family)
MTPNRRRLINREDLLLVISAAVLGLGGAAAFAAYRAVSASGQAAGGRFGEFASNLFWPGVLIFLAVAAVVWFGWKANLD